jgi:hypothetical protein
VAASPPSSRRCARYGPVTSNSLELFSLFLLLATILGFVLPGIRPCATS